MNRLVSTRRAWLRKWSWHKPAVRAIAAVNHRIYTEQNFEEKLQQERRRAERSGRPLLVMVLEAEKLKEIDETGQLSKSVSESISSCIRSTDACGLLSKGNIIGVILTEVEIDKVSIAQEVMALKIKDKLITMLGEELVQRITVSCRVYTESDRGTDLFDLTFYPEVTSITAGDRIADAIKRTVDIIGSIGGLMAFSPFFLMLPILIKTTSKGPVFFKQERVGKNGKPFELLKFRSMYLDNDDVIHREYVKQLIRGNSSVDTVSTGVYKIQGDPRITKVGKFIRKYSLDELPQFINVLRGDMSLVGPRPPIRYEVENYRLWQRNRLIGKKPGITGLWQVTGRSSTTFDEMVRLDLRYMNRWTIALDFKILLCTPAAVIKCKGAY